MSVEQTLAELVRIDSRSSNSNEAVVDYARARVEAAGLRTRVLSYADERNVEKFQLLAFAPEEAFEVELALVGHTDTMKRPQNPLIFSPF
jgi:acetylornithine deacetylase/succinyl-diaminopimelate desuccinylase-like protein